MNEWDKPVILSLKCLAGVLALLGMVALSSCSDFSGGARPVGTVEDLMALKDRDDVNVLFVLIDTLRADRLNCYGNERETSPVIDSLAEDGILFANHLAQSSWTKCSMASMWTGVYPNRTGVLRSRHAVSEEALMPAEILSEAGFRTAGVFRNGWVERNFGFGQGFEVYMMPRTPTASMQESRADPAKVMGSDGDVIRAAAGFLRAHQSERWFLYLHLLDVHQYVSDSESSVFGTSYSDIYDNAILWTDTLIGHLLAEVEALDLRERTVIVIASDHGEAFGEHGKDGHAYDVHGEVTEVPWIVSLPFALDSGVVVDTRSENIDIWPTLLDLLGLSPLLDPDGESFLPVVVAEMTDGATRDSDKLAFAQLDEKWGRLEGEDRPLVSVTDGKWRLLYSGSDESLELFDKEADPTEQNSLASSESEVADALKAEVMSYLDRDEIPWGSSELEVEINEMELQQLRALGYGIQ